VSSASGSNGFMAPAKKEFSAVAFLKDLAIVSTRTPRNRVHGRAT
jgi:hypothetical protein